MTRLVKLRLLAACLLLAAFPPVAAAALQGFHGIHSRDGDDVWAVGDTGSVYRSLDGGGSWSSSTLGTLNLRDVAAVGYRVLVAGDAGVVWSSSNSGGTWSIAVVPGSPDLRGLAQVSSLTAYVVGSGGAIAKTTDGGATWTPQASGTSVRLHACAFASSQNGWAVGEGGTVLHTVNGGANWSPVAVGTTKALYSVAVAGEVVWVVGAEGAALKSVNGGVDWAPVPLKIDSRADVRAVVLEDENTVWLAGGGGFIRKSVDGGASWEFPLHPMHAQISGFAVTNGRAFACSNRHRVPMASADGGVTWALPAGATVSRAWSQRLAYQGNVRGNNLQLHPRDRNTVYDILGASIYVSHDAGDSWSVFTNLPDVFVVNSFLISPKDTNVFLVAVGQPKRIMKSIDHGATWDTTRIQVFGEYGVPLEMHPDRPDTVYFGADNSGLLRSTDFGSTWSVISANNFRSPCDILVVPDSSNVIVIGDGITGSGTPPDYYKSVDGGATFTLTHTRPTGPTEIPNLATSRLRHNTIFGTNWGSGGMQRSTDFGSTWPTVTSIANGWGVDIARDDPNCVLYAQYGGGQSYLSDDGGTTFVNTPLSGSNSALYVRDRETFLAQQTNGIWKLNFTYNYTPNNTEALSLVSPDGGEAWSAGTVRNITWSSTNLALARIEYRTAPGQWQTLAEVPGYHHNLAWSLPCVAAATARVRVVDAWDSTPGDSSAADFTIGVAQMSPSPAKVDFDAHPAGSQTLLPVTLSNPGSGDLVVTSITVKGGGPFTPARGAVTIPAGASDTVGVVFSPSGVGFYDDTLVVNGNACATPVAQVALHGAGVGSALAAGDRALRTGVWQNRPNPFRGATEIEYALAAAGEVDLEVYDVLGHRVATLARGRKQPGSYRVSFGPGRVTAGGERLGEIPAGVYFYRFRAGAYATTRKMLFLR